MAWCHKAPSHYLKHCHSDLSTFTRLKINISINKIEAEVIFAWYLLFLCLYMYFYIHLSSDAPLAILMAYSARSNNSEERAPGLC